MKVFNKANYGCKEQIINNLKFLPLPFRTAEIEQNEIYVCVENNFANKFVRYCLGNF